MTLITEPKITTYAEYIAMREAIADLNVQMIVYIGHLEYRKPDGNLFEAGFFELATSQGFCVTPRLDIHSPSLWCPWGTTYTFYIIQKGGETE